MTDTFEINSSMRLVAKELANEVDKLRAVIDDAEYYAKNFEDQAAAKTISSSISVQRRRIDDVLKRFDEACAITKNSHN